MKTPIDVATRETVSFITSHLLPESKLLEIGSGRGDVAVALHQRGFQAVAVDPDPTALDQAKQFGVTAIHASWPQLEVEPVDAIAFTRSLHHIHPLSEAVHRAHQVLKPNGKLLLEDFAFDQADAATINWLLEKLQSESGKAMISTVPDEFVTSLLQATDPVEAWHHDHDHDLHSIAHMIHAIEERFTIEETQAVPYLYRYLIPVLPENSQAAQFIDDVFHEEAQKGSRGEIVLIGRRVVAVRKKDVFE